jgi:hypothetical protein
LGKLKIIEFKYLVKVLKRKFSCVFFSPRRIFPELSLKTFKVGLVTNELVYVYTRLDELVHVCLCLVRRAFQVSAIVHYIQEDLVFDVMKF